MMSPFSMKNEIAQIGKRLAEKGMIAGTDGNISVRLDDDRIMITPSGLAKGRLQPDDLVIVDLAGRKLQGAGNASTEIAMHLFVYQQRAEIKACVHAHPPYSTAFAVSGRNLAEDILPGIVVAIGGIPMTDYAPPGTDAVPKALAPHIAEHNGFLLRNHGLLTIGRTLEEAYNRHESVEHFARIVHLALQLGNVNSIPSDDFKRLETIRKRLDATWDKQS